MNQDTNLTAINKIKSSFKNVRRGRVGLREARALDDRLDESDPTALEIIRMTDIETDWERISDELLMSSPHIFGFLDDDGLKFVMPAVFVWSYAHQGQYNDVPEYLFYTLLPTSRGARQAHDLIENLRLTADQIRVIFDWLVYHIEGNGGLEKLKLFERSQLDKWKLLLA